MSARNKRDASKIGFFFPKASSAVFKRKQAALLFVFFVLLCNHHVNEGDLYEKNDMRAAAFVRCLVLLFN